MTNVNLKFHIVEPFTNVVWCIDLTYYRPIVYIACVTDAECVQFFSVENKFGKLAQSCKCMTLLGQINYVY
jgi:hypothetical protein